MGHIFCFILILHTKLLLRAVFSKRNGFAFFRIKFIPFGVDSVSEGRQDNFERVASVKSVLFPLK